MHEKWIRRIEALVCTGTPGLYRVVGFWWVQRVYSLEELGRAASNMSIAQMMGFLTAIGWATLILVRVPASDSKQAAVDAFYSLACMAGLCLLVAILGTLAISASGLLRFDCAGTTALLCGWTAYQTARHYFVAQRRYRIAIIFDIGLIGGSCLLIAACHRYGSTASTGMAAALGMISLAMFAAVGKPTRQAMSWRLDIKGLQFGLTNFLSGGISLIVVPAAKSLCGASFAGMLSLFSSVTAIGNLLPRAISMTQLPDLVKRKKERIPLDVTIATMQRHVMLSNLSVLALNIALVIGLTYDYRIAGREAHAVLAGGILLSLQCAAGVLSVVSSNILMAFEKSAITASINIRTSLTFAALLACGIAYGGEAGFFFILVSAVLVTLARSRVVARHADRICNAHVASLSVPRDATPDLAPKNTGSSQ